MKKRSGFQVMLRLVGLVRPLAGFMALAILLGLVGHLCAAFLTVLGGYALAGALGIPFADAGAWEVELAFDGVHFTPRGHQAFARGMDRALRFEIRGFRMPRRTPLQCAAAQARWGRRCPARSCQWWKPRPQCAPPPLPGSIPG